MALYVVTPYRYDDILRNVLYVLHPLRPITHCDNLPLDIDDVISQIIFLQNSYICFMEMIEINNGRAQDLNHALDMI